METEMDETFKKWLDTKFNNTDDKISTMSDTVIRTEERLNNHLESTERKQLRNKDIILIGLAVFGGIIALIQTIGI